MREVDRFTRFGNYILDTIGIIILLVIQAFILDEWLQIIPEDGSPFLAIYFFFYIFFIISFLNIFLAEHLGNS